LIFITQQIFLLSILVLQKDQPIAEAFMIRLEKSPKLAEEAPGLALGRNRLVFVQQSIEE